MRRFIGTLLLYASISSLALAQQTLNPYNIKLGQSAGEVAAGNDSRIVGALQANRNLSDLTNLTAARSSLGLGILAPLTGVQNLTVSDGALSLNSGNVDAALGYAPVNPASLAPSATTDTTNANNITTGLLAPARLSIATANTLGGVSASAGLNVSGAGALSVIYGIAANTAAQGNDARITGALSAATAASTYAPLSSPNFTGIPTAPTPASTDNSNALATTSFVATVIAGTAADYITTINTTGGNTIWIPTRAGGVAIITGALTSPAVIIAPSIGAWEVINRTTGAYSVTVKTSLGSGVTAAQGFATSLVGDGTNIIRAATDLAYGPTLTNANLNSATLNTSILNNSAITNSTIDGTVIGQTTPAAAIISSLTVTGSVGGAGIAAALLPYAPIASPNFTGTPTAPTPTAGDNSTKLATTAFVSTATATLATSTATTYAPTASPTFTGTMNGAALSLTGNATIGGTLGVTGIMSVGSTLNIGTGVAANANTTIKTPNGSNIIINPQGTAYTQIGSALNVVGTITPEASGVWSGSGYAGNSAILENTTWTGTSTAGGNPTAFNAFGGVDSVDSSGATGATMLWIRDNISSSAKKGGANALVVSLNFTAATGNASGSIYTGLNSTVNVASGDNGTSGHFQGSFTAANPVLQLSSAALYTAGGSGEEIDVGFAAAATTKIGLLVDQLSTDTTNATVDDIGIAIDAQSGSTSGFLNGLSFGRSGGSFPIKSTGTLIYGEGNGGAAWTVANGIDWHLGTATGNWLNLGGVFTVSGAGNTSISGTLGVTGNATFSSPVTVNASESVGGVLSTPAIYVGSQGTITWSGTQGAAGTSQYALLTLNSLAGTLTSTVGNNVDVVVNDDTVQSPSSTGGVNWFNIQGNVGITAWKPSTGYTTNNKSNVGGNIYQNTVASCTSASSGGPSGTGSAITDGTCSWNYLGTDWNGKRAAMSVEIGFNGQDSTVANDSSRQEQAAIFTTVVGAPMGGTAPHSGNSAGFFYATGNQMWCKNGAVNLSGCIGNETDVGIFTGASAASRVGQQIISFGNLQGGDYDIGLRFGATNTGGTWSPGFGQLIALADGAVSSTGAIMQYSPALGISAGGYSDTAPKAALGIDLAAYNFSTAAFRAAGGFVVDGLGNANIGSAKISTAGATVSLNASGSKISTIAISNAGGGYVAGDQLYDPTTGTIITVSTVSSGAIATWVLTVPGAVSSGTPPTTATLLGGSGAGASVTYTWITASTLALQQGGGGTTVGGSLTIGAGSTGGQSITGNGTGNFGITLGGSASLYSFKNSSGQPLLIMGGATETATFLSNSNVSILTLGGTSFDIEPDTNITLQGGAWGAGTLVNNHAPIFQNATISGTSVSPSSADGLFLQQLDEANNATTGAVTENLDLSTGEAGNREAGSFNLSVSNPTTNNGAAYVGVREACNINATDIGGPSSCFGSNPVAHITAGSQASGIIGSEIDTWVEQTAVVLNRIGLQIVDTTGSTYGQQATQDDVALTLNNQYEPSATLGFKVGLEFGRYGGYFPVATNGTLIFGQDSHGAAFTVANGIDWHLGTATGNWLNLGGVFTVAGSGNVTIGGAGQLTVGTGGVTAPSAQPLILTGGGSTTITQIKAGPNGGGVELLEISGNSSGIAPQINVSLPGGTWSSGTLINNIAPLSQNAQFTGSTAGAEASFGAYLQQTDIGTVTSGNAPGTGFQENLILNGASVSGYRDAGFFSLLINQTGQTGAQDYTGLTGKCYINFTDVTTGSSCFAFNAVSTVGTGITVQQNVGAEIDTWELSGAVITDRIGVQIVDLNGTTYGTRASRDDVALTLNNQYAPSSTLGFKIGLEFGRAGGNFPVATTGTLIYGQGAAGVAWTVANGIDWHLGTFTGNSWNDGHIQMTGAGDLLANSATPLATTATAGFLHLPNTTAAPTGTPTNTTPGCEWNTGTHTLNCYDGSSWYHFTGVSGAG